MTVPQEILGLVERFDNNLDAYRSGSYNETQLRREFVDPFFKILGWDVNNEKGYAEAYKDVIHGDSIKVGGLTKAPDYCFRIGGTRKFFVETKKPSVNLKDDISPAFQLRRYAWSAKLPLSILTDFEEFAVYDCRAKPDKSDKASTARILYLTYTEYAQRWDEISQIFSRDAVLKGSFDKYAESSKVKKGTASVDDAFLKEIESWRDTLARSLALRNPDLTQYDLNFTVQRTIDRIVFLRICEDRGIEKYGRLMALQNGDRVYARLCEMFHRADERYNSGLFHFQKDKSRAESPDTLTLNVTVDDSALKNIIKNLYYPDSPYEFSVISSDILGQVYEQFLGKVIRLTAGHRAVVEEKPEVRKAGGVYYTPTYIVDYIVKNTVGKLLECGLQNDERIKIPISKGGSGVVKSPLTKGEMGVVNTQNPKSISKLKILDPACSSGSFLLGAYTYLLDWHRDWYVTDGREKWATGRSPVLYQGMGGDWRLTTAECKRILLNNIYGVDIDPQAVEVTKLSLLLKVLEGESEQTLARQLKLFHERALPDLGNNIKCGNSLIGTDFYNTPLTPLFRGEKMDSPLARGAGGVSDEERYRINPFDWDKEFPEIIKPSPAGREQGTGGFDVVIGNPPYLRIQGLQEFYGNQIDYFISHYRSAVKRFDLYLLFAEKGFRLLAKGGYLGFICPHKFVNSDFGSGLRRFLLEESAINSIVSFGNNLIFNQASTYTCILLLSKENNTSFNYYEFPDMPIVELSSRLFQQSKENLLNYDLQNFSENPWVLTTKGVPTVLNRLSHQPKKLGDVCDEVLVGVQSGIDNIHVLKVVGKTSGKVIKLFSERAGKNVDIEAALVKPFLRGEDIHRYEEPQYTYYCIYPYQLLNGKTKIIEEDSLKERFPLGYDYLKEYRRELTEIRVRQKTNPKYWYSCHRSRDMKVFESKRIITPEISLGCNMTLSLAGIYHNTKVYSIVPSTEQPENIHYWLRLLNSKLMWWFLSNTGYVLRGGYFVFKTNYLNPFPARTINFSVSDDKASHDRMVALVDQMLELHKQLASARTDHEKTAIQRQTDATDRQIDQLVYELYGLTEEEIKIVEESSP